MRALLLAAGLGTRLRPITDEVPKCLVTIRGRPLLDIWCESLISAGVEKILVNLHYKSDQVLSHLAKANYQRFVETVFEPELLGTAGTLIKNRNFFGEKNAVLVHADNYSEASISSIIDAHSLRPSGCELTMLAFRTKTPESCGILEIDENKVLMNMYEKSRENHGNLANAAFYVISKDVIKNLSNEIDFSTQVIPKYFRKIFVIETNQIYIDIGTPESYQLAQEIANVS